MRWDFDQTISRYNQDLADFTTKNSLITGELAEVEEKIRSKNIEILTTQKETVNIDQAIAHINAALSDLAIDDFFIQKYSDNLYQIVRATEGSSAFTTLSEGERMIITFLYFCELCNGRLNAEDTNDEKIVVIDDPISSLSHIYIFNVGRLIKSLFLRSALVKQVFILTHSLYFFYELTDTDHERRDKEQSLFRLSKSKTGSTVRPMKYDEIQNDYQSYWEIVNDVNQHPALIANCMRNIIEHFFNFVRKTDLNNVFQLPALQNNKHQAFYRYINRESHSLGQNIFDIKEFDYESFKEGLRLVFVETGYGDHYRQMSKIH